MNLICTWSRYLKSRSIVVVTPFKTIFRSLIENSSKIRSISVGVDKALKGMSFDDFNEEDSKDLYLTDVEFVKEWLPRVREDLENLSISDFWIQSCWRKSDILALISSNCKFFFSIIISSSFVSDSFEIEVFYWKTMMMMMMMIYDSN